MGVVPNGNGGGGGTIFLFILVCFAKVAGILLLFVAMDAFFLHKAWAFAVLGLGVAIIAALWTRYCIQFNREKRERQAYLDSNPAAAAEAARGSDWQLYLRGEPPRTREQRRLCYGEDKWP